MAWIRDFATTENTSASTSNVATMPIHEIDDLLLWIVSKALATDTFTTPDGWNNLFIQQSVAGTAVFWKVATSDAESEPETVITSAVNHSVMISIADINTTTPIDIYGAASVATAVQFTSASVTTTVTDTLVLYGVTSDGSATSCLSDPGTMFLMSQDASTVTTSVAWTIQRAIGVTAPLANWTQNQTASTNRFTIAIANKSGGKIPAYVDDSISCATLINPLHHFSTLNNVSYPTSLTPAAIGEHSAVYDAAAATADYGINPYSSAIYSSPSQTTLANNTVSGPQINFTSPLDLTSGVVACSVYGGNPRDANTDLAKVAQDGAMIGFFSADSNQAVGACYQVDYHVPTTSTYATSNRDSSVNMYSGSVIGVGQSFPGDAGRTLEQAWFFLIRVGKPTGTMVAKCYAHSGTYGTSSIPTGAALATSDTVDCSILTKTWAFVPFHFTTGTTLTAGTNYVITIEYSGGTSANCVSVGTDTSSPTHGGNFSSLTGATWTAVSGTDTCFMVETSSLTDYTTAANNSTHNDVIPYPATEATGDFIMIGYSEKFRKIIVDDTGGVRGVGGAVVWEGLLNTGAWASLATLTDGTTGFTTALADGKAVSWTTTPPLWWKVSMYGLTARYWIRARCSTVWTTNPQLDQIYITVTPTRSFMYTAANSIPNTEGRAIFAINVNQTTTAIYTNSVAPTVSAITGMYFGTRALLGALGLYFSELHKLGTFVVAGGNSTNPVDVLGINDIGKSFRLPVIQRTGSSALYSYEKIQFGGGDAIYMVLENSSLQFPRIYNTDKKEVSYHAESGEIGVSYYGQSGDTINHINSVISSASPYYFEINSSASALATYDFAGLSVVGADPVTLRDVTTFTDMSFIGCGEIDASGCDLESCIISNGIDTAAILITTTTTLINCTIKDNTRGIRITSAGTYELDGTLFSGNTYDIENASPGVVTINCINGANPTTYINTGGGSTSIVTAVTLTVTIKDENNNAIEGVQIMINKLTPTEYTSDTGNDAGDGDLVVNETVDTDTPQTGTITVWDKSANKLMNYRYASWTSKTFTFPTEVTGTANTGGSSTSLKRKTGTSFLTADIKEGDTVRNTTDGSWGVVDEIVDADTITLFEPLIGGSDNTWQEDDAYSFHKLAVTLIDNDDIVKVPIMNDQTNASGVATRTYTGAATNIRIDARSSSGATKYQQYTTTGAITGDGLNTTIVMIEDTEA